MTIIITRPVRFRQILGITNTQSQCFVCFSPVGRNAVPWPAIQQVWFKKKIFIPKSNRICKDHLDPSKRFNAETLQKIDATKKGITVEVSDFELWMREISKLPNSSPYNFDEGEIDEAMYKTFCGITKSDFDDLVTYLYGKPIPIAFFFVISMKIAKMNRNILFRHEKHIDAIDSKRISYVPNAFAEQSQTRNYCIRFLN